MVIATVVSIVIIVYNQKLPADHRLFRIALGLQLGGALGNLLSRIRIGHVTDFLDFGPWPVSNIADISIVSGTILLGILMILQKDEEPAQVEDVPAENAESGDQGDSGEDSPMIWNE